MKKILFMFMLVTALFAVSCGGPSTPTQAANELYDLIIDGKYEAASEYFNYDKVKPEELDESKAMIVSMLKEKVAPMIEKKGGIKSYEILEETISEDGKSANVKTKMVYGDGSEDTDKLEFVLTEDGQWKASLGK